MKYLLEHKGTTVAQADWSNILFHYIRSRPENKQSDYLVRNSETGLPAGLSTK